MKKWLVIILLLSGVSSLEASGIPEKRVCRLPSLVELQRERVTKNIGLFPVSPASTETVDLEESMAPLSISTASSQSSMLSIKTPLTPVSLARKAFIPLIIWQGHGDFSTERGYYLEKKDKNFCVVDYKEGQEFKLFPYLEAFAEMIQNVFKKEIEDIYFGVPIDPVMPITSYSVCRYREICCLQDFYFEETLENLIQYSQRYGHLHVILEAD